MSKLRGDKPKKMPWEKSSQDSKLGRTELSRLGFYASSKWRTMRAYILDKEPLCRRCLENGKVTPANVVDHIEPVGPESSHKELFGEDNLRPLCHRCHTIITNQSGSKNSAQNLKKGRDLMNDLEN